MRWADIEHWKAWAGWRRYAPATAAVIVHGVIAVGVAGAMALTTPDVVAPQRYIAIDLLTVEPEIAPVLAGVTPPRSQEASAQPRKTDAGPRVTPSGPVASSARAVEDGDGVYLAPPSVLVDPDAAPGLRGLAGNDPCASRYGPRAQECVGKELAVRTGKMDSLMPRSKQELAQHFGEYLPTCAYRVGCEPKGEWISTNGTRVPPPQSAASAGAEQLGGIHDSVGRLDFNPDHFDRGFGD